MKSYRLHYERSHLHENSVFKLKNEILDSIMKLTEPVKVKINSLLHSSELFSSFTLP